MNEAPFRQDPTYFFYKMIVLVVVNRHFIERFPTKKKNCGHCEWGTISPRFSAFLLQNGSAGRCEPPFYGEASRKKKSSRIVDVVSEAPFHQDSTYFFYKTVMLDIVNHHFIKRFPKKKKIVDVVSETPFHQDPTHFLHKMVGLCHFTLILENRINLKNILSIYQGYIYYNLIGFYKLKPPRKKKIETPK